MKQKFLKFEPMERQMDTLPSKSKKWENKAQWLDQSHDGTEAGTQREPALQVLLVLLVPKNQCCILHVQRLKNVEKSHTQISKRKITFFNEREVSTGKGNGRDADIALLKPLPTLFQNKRVVKTQQNLRFYSFSSA